MCEDEIKSGGGLAPVIASMQNQSVDRPDVIILWYVLMLRASCDARTFLSTGGQCTVGVTEKRPASRNRLSFSSLSSARDGIG